MSKVLSTLVSLVVILLVLSSCLETKPDLKPIIKKSNDYSMVVYKSKVATFWDLRTSFKENMLIILTNKTDNKLYTNYSYYQNGLVFIPNLPKGQYKISYLFVPLHGDKAWEAYFDDNPISKDLEEVNVISNDAKIGKPDIFNKGIDAIVYSQSRTVNFYNSATLDFIIDKEGIYYLGNYSISNIEVSMAEGKTMIQKIDDSNSINEITSFITNDKTMWDKNTIYYSTNVFYKDKFYLK